MVQKKSILKRRSRDKEGMPRFEKAEDSHQDNVFKRSTTEFHFSKKSEFNKKKLDVTTH